MNIEYLLLFVYFFCKNISHKFLTLNVLLAKDIEEVIDAIQHQCYYDDLMVSTVKNYEFEAKVFFELYDFANGLNANYLPNASNTNPNFVKPYEAWIDGICNNMNGRFTDVNGFNSLCEMWNGYSGTTIFNFQPELLKYIFRKPIPIYPEIP